MSARLQQMPSKVMRMEKGEKIHSPRSVLFPPSIPDL